MQVSRYASLAAAALIAATSFFAAFDAAEARRAGSFGFGSRGMRTYQAPPVTRTAPTTAAPIERSMTPRTQTTNSNGFQQPAARNGLFGGFGRSMFGGLLAGGLLGMMLGHGFGGGFGFLGMLLQIGLLIGGAMLLMRFLANRNRTASASSGFTGNHAMSQPTTIPFQIPAIGGGSGTQSRQSNDQLGLKQADLDAFEELLTSVQTAYGHEDYGTLRRLTTPEAMSYLAEELGENATAGVRNQVSDVRLLQGDIAESWREGDTDYATLAMRYASVDAMVDRSTGRVVGGDQRNATESTEIWTFVRKNGDDWKLAAIQGTESRAA